MVCTAHQAITSILLVLATAVCFHAQTTTQKIASASISGKVTIKGKPAVGVMVLAKDPNDYNSSRMARYRARTDQTGSYRIANLPAGTYKISPIAPALVPANQSDSLIVSEGEHVEDINVLLVPGGVITGKITDSGGEPLIGQYVTITPVYEQPGVVPSVFNRTPLMRVYSPDNSTDDRGVYRAFGLPPGKYKVSVGGSSYGTNSSREYYKETFYPSVTDAAKATIIEVTEGSETNHVDIALGRPVRKFSIAGRVVDGETGRPIPNLNYDVGQTTDLGNGSSSSSTWSGGITNANGEFRLEIAKPGTYTISTVPPDGSDLVKASITFEVVDRDRPDLLIKMTKGGSLSGVVALDGNERALATLSGLRIYAAVTSQDANFGNSSASTVGADGTFSINGVGSGLARFGVSSFGDKRMEFKIERVERNGIPFETINVKEREHVAGIRVVVKYVKLTGAIRGQVKVENGELPPISQLFLSLWPLDENLEPKRSHSIGSPELDARGHFLAEGLPAGTYQLSVYVYSPERTKTVDIKRQVTVTDDTVTDVTLIIKPQPDPN